MSRIYLSPPHLGEEEQGFLRDAIASNWITGIGPDLAAFEGEVASYLGVRGAVGLSSGTAAIHLGLQLLGVGPGDVVLCSSLTFVASAAPILYLGAEPAFVDSDETSWNLSPAALRRALEDRRPKALVVVNLYGQSAAMDPIVRLAAEYEVPILEDAAESFGATYHGKRSGTFGRFGVLSFNGNKIITTSGGGMLVSDDTEALDRARFLASQAREPYAHYEHREIGYNYRLSNLLAALGRGQLRHLADRVTARREIFERYRQGLCDLEGVEFMPELPDTRGTRWLSTLTLDPARHPGGAKAVVDALARENIEARPLWKPLHLQPLFKNARYYRDSTACVSSRLFESGVCLPSGSSLTEEDQNRILGIVRATLAGSKPFVPVRPPSHPSPELR